MFDAFTHFVTNFQNHGWGNGCYYEGTTSPNSKVESENSFIHVSEIRCCSSLAWPWDWYIFHLKMVFSFFFFFLKAFCALSSNGIDWSSIFLLTGSDAPQVFNCVRDLMIPKLPWLSDSCLHTFWLLKMQVSWTCFLFVFIVMQVVEIPKGSKVKYELDKKTGLIKVRSVFQSYYAKGKIYTLVWFS